MLVFQNCNEVQFQSVRPNGAASTEEENQRIIEVERNCNTLTHQQLNQTINFPSNWNVSHSTTLCQWEHGYGAGLIMARNEETKSFQLPPGAQLCDVSFSIQNQTFQYDDMFLLNFNDVVLVSAASFFHGFTKWQGYDLYDWSSLDGVGHPAEYNSNSFIYCAGANSGLGSCTVPPTESSGNFSLSYDDSLIQRIGLRGGGSTHTFKLVVTGDDNPDIDCRHEALSFNINATYVIP